MKSMLLAGAILLAASLAHADPASHRSFAGVLSQNPNEWFPVETIANGTVTVVVTQNMLDAAARDAITPEALLKEFLEGNGFCGEAEDFPDFNITKPWPVLYVLLYSQALHVDVGKAPARDSHGHVLLDAHGNPRLTSSPGTITHRYITGSHGQVVAVHDFRPQPQQCVVPGLTS